MASTSASSENMHAACFSRRRCRGVWFKEHVYQFLICYAETLKVSFNSLVNMLLEKIIAEGLSGEGAEKLVYEAKLEARLAQLRMKSKNNSIWESSCSDQVDTWALMFVDCSVETKRRKLAFNVE